MKRTNELNLKNTDVTLYDEWVEIIEDVAIRLNKRYLKKFGHLENLMHFKFMVREYYPLWKIQEYKKIWSLPRMAYGTELLKKYLSKING